VEPRLARKFKGSRPQLERTVRVLILYANPLETSFVSALHKQALITLETHGHAVDDCDLYRESFEPALSREERLTYNDVGRNSANVRTYVDRLLAAEGLILVYPVWNEGFPAILKGYIDRVFLPGVSFQLTPDGSSRPSLRKLKRMAAICTYGADRFNTFILGDPPRRVVKRLLSALAPRATCEYLALYGLNRGASRSRDNFVKEIESRLANW
jgi:NAD(P)H dehydrogenase (quinone)